jgi:cation transport protein ChaC
MLHTVIDEKLMQNVLRLAGRGDLNVFAYGSLMWNPGFPHKSLHTARVYGYSRRLSVFSTHYRGTEKVPGLVFGLDIGGSCCGVLLRTAKANKEDVMRYLFRREMFANVYEPRYVHARLLKNNAPVRALTFVVRRDRPSFAPPMDTAAAIAIIQRAHGVGGANKDYIISTYHELVQRGVHYPQLGNLLNKLK